MRSRMWALGMVGAVSVVAVLFAWVGAGLAQERWPTPEIRQIEVMQAGDGIAHAMRGEVGNTGTYVGLAIVCSEQGGEEAKVMTFFGGFPADRRPVQLAVRRPDGVVERFGAVVSGGLDSGFHSPRIFDGGEAERFAEAALREGALVSNGYRSFWNRVSEENNREVRERFIRCVRKK